MTIGTLLDGGFRIVRERGGALLIWTLIQLIAVGATDFAVAALVQNNIDAVLGGASPMDVQMTYVLQYSLVGLGGLAVGTILYAAAQRVVIHPTEGGPGWLRLGMDEVRLFLLLLLYLVLFVVACIPVGIIAVSVFGSSGGGSDSPGQLVLVIFGLIAGAYFATRLSLTFPLTLKRKAFSMDDGWRLTRGHFWTLLATYLLIFLLLFAVGILIVLATEPGYLSAISQYGFASPEADQASLRKYEMLMQGNIDAAIIVQWVLTSIQGAIGCALFGGAAATAVQQLTTDEEGLSETFS